MIRGSLHRFVLGTREAPGLGGLYRGLYAAAVAGSARALAAVPGIEGVFLHRGMTRGAWEPGVSDIDLILMREALPSVVGEGEFLRRLGRRVGALKRAFPMLGDLWIAEPGELAAYLRWGGLRAWEDRRDWRRLRGTPAPAAPLAESPGKRRWLDPWAWAFVSHMEISRRLLRPGDAVREKGEADLRKLYLDLCRYADFIEAGERAFPATRRELMAASPEAARLSPREIWLDSARRLSRASRAVLRRLAPRESAKASFPAGSGGGPGAQDSGRLLSAAPGSRAVICDPPYHTYLLLAEGATDRDYDKAADALIAAAVPGVPLVLEPAAWALALQSSYLGAPLGWLGWDGEPCAPEGLFAGWGPRAFGEAKESLPLLPRDLRWEIAAEAASWMALWWRYLWIAPGWPNRFVLYHLYTRALGLRLVLEGSQSGPFSDLDGLIARSLDCFPEEESFLRSLGRFQREEPGECVDSLPREGLAPDLLEGAGGLIRGSSRRLQGAPAACSLS